jgi:hypothetical protein
VSQLDTWTAEKILDNNVIDAIVAGIDDPGTDAKPGR